MPTQNPVEGLRPAAFALFGAWLMFMGANEMIGRLRIQVDGVIVAANTTTGNRPVTSYVLRGRDGHDSEYVAGPTDASLPRRLPLGTRIHKDRWRLSYLQNGVKVESFPWLHYGALILGGIGLEVVALRQWRLQKKYRLLVGAV